MHTVAQQPSRALLIWQTWNPVLTEQQLPFSSPSPWQSPLYFLFLRVWPPKICHLSGTTVFVFLWLAYFTYNNILMVHPHCTRWQEFLLFKAEHYSIIWIDHISLSVNPFIIHDGHLGCSHPLVMENNAMNLGVQTSQDPVLLLLETYCFLFLKLRRTQWCQQSSTSHCGHLPFGTSKQICLS